MSSSESSVDNCIYYNYNDKKTVMKLLTDRRVCDVIYKNRNRDNTIFFKDKDVAMMAVMVDGLALKYFKKYFGNDEDIILTAISRNKQAYFMIDSDLQLEEKYILSAIKFWPSIINDMHIDIRNNKKYFLYAVSLYPSAVEKASSIMKSDRDVISMAVSKGYSLSKVDKVFRNDKNIVMKSVSRDGHEIKYASIELQSDMDVCIASLNSRSGVIINDVMYEKVFKYMFKDKQILLKTLEKDPLVYNKLDFNQRDDEEVAYLAVKFFREKYNNLGYKLDLTEKILNNKRIMLEAVLINGGDCSWFTMVGNSLKTDVDIIITAVKNNSYLFDNVDEYLDKCAYENKDLIIKLISMGCRLNIKLDIDDINNDTLFKLMENKKIAWTLVNSSKRLRSNKELILKALKVDPSILFLVDHHLFMDEDFIKKVVKTSDKCKKYAKKLNLIDYWS